jgi:hypothetical protein
VKDNYLFMLKYILIAIFPLYFTLPSKQQFYIALNGNDTNNGSYIHPFATLEAAQKAVRKIRLTKPTIGIEVIIRGGEYFIPETIEFLPEDSGTPSNPVIWKAADGEKVILSGGRLLQGNWNMGKDSVWYLKIPNTKGWKRDVFKAEAYQKRPTGPWNFRQLFVSEKRAIRARFPNSSEQNPFLYVDTTIRSTIRILPKLVSKSWGNEDDAQINIVPRWRFFNQWNDLIGVDNINGSLELGPREQHFEIDRGSWFWVEGIKSELDSEGEWYLDHSEGVLYYKPFNNENPNSQSIIAPFLNRIFYLKGDVNNNTYVKHIQFEGFEFRHTTYSLGQIEARVHTDGVIVMENAQFCSVSKCKFDNIGGYALWMHLDSRNNIFDSNHVNNSGAGGVLMTGSRLSYMDDTKIYTKGDKAAKYFPILNQITRNLVENCGKIRYYGGGVHIDSRPATMAMEPGNYIAHNHFRNLSRNGIFIFRNQGGNVVEYNEIHDCMQTTIDGAAIHFATMNRLAAPNFILNNYLYDIWGYEQLPSGIPRRTLANGIFLEWATSNTTIENNVIYNSGEKEIKTIMGNWDLNIKNNHTSATPIPYSQSTDLGIYGTASFGIKPEQLKLVGGVITSDNKMQVSYTGNWELKRIAGMRDLFKYNCLQASPKQHAECTYVLPINESGVYQLTIMYFPDTLAASNATISIKHVGGVTTTNWNFKKGDKLGFAIKLGEYSFSAHSKASVTISNENSDGFIIADAIGYVKKK